MVWLIEKDLNSLKPASYPSDPEGFFIGRYPINQKDTNNFDYLKITCYDYEPGLMQGGGIENIFKIKDMDKRVKTRRGVISLPIQPGISESNGVGWGENELSPIQLAGAKIAVGAIDALTGKPEETFGENGRVDLRKNLGRPYKEMIVIANTPGVVYDNILIQGSRVHEGPGASPGHIRAYDLNTGEMVWRFNTIPHPGEYGYETWPKDAWKYAGGANSWAGMALDEKMGIVYIPTGSASFDFYGGDRKGKNLFANSLKVFRVEQQIDPICSIMPWLLEEFHVLF